MDLFPTLPGGHGQDTRERTRVSEHARRKKTSGRDLRGEKENEKMRFGSPKGKRDAERASVVVVMCVRNVMDA